MISKDRLTKVVNSVLDCADPKRDFVLWTGVGGVINMVEGLMKEQDFSDRQIEKEKKRLKLTLRPGLYKIDGETMELFKAELHISGYPVTK